MTLHKRRSREIILCIKSEANLDDVRLSMCFLYIRICTFAMTTPKSIIVSTM